jgi:hypothetical protein
MASGGASFIATTPVSGLPVGQSSPTRPMKTSGMKKSSASELLDQIRQLEVEGQKLRNSNLINLGKDSRCREQTCQGNLNSRPPIVLAQYSSVLFYPIFKNYQFKQ